MTAMTATERLGVSHILDAIPENQRNPEVAQETPCKPDLPSRRYVCWLVGIEEQALQSQGRE
jgi:hypothetical protein